MLQNATLLRKSAPWPPNSSDEHVSCTAPATRKTSCQILCICPRSHACHRLGNATKPSRFCSLLIRCIIPCTCHAKRHLNVQPDFLHFWLRNVLRATTACTFSTSQLPKVLRTRQFFTLWASQCASRHNTVHFFDISTSKSGPSMVFFAHFDFHMCFAPQRRATFHLSSDHMAPHPPL